MFKLCAASLLQSLTSQCGSTTEHWLDHLTVQFYESKPHSHFITMKQKLGKCCTFLWRPWINPHSDSFVFVVVRDNNSCCCLSKGKCKVRWASHICDLTSTEELKEVKQRNRYQMSWLLVTVSLWRIFIHFYTFRWQRARGSQKRNTTRKQKESYWRYEHTQGKQKSEFMIKVFDRSSSLCSLTDCMCDVWVEEWLWV